MTARDSPRQRLRRFLTWAGVMRGHRAASFTAIKTGTRLSPAQMLSPDDLRLLVRDPHCRFHFAQSGEDVVLWRILRERTHGFYVDVGAHHPRRFSNTYLVHRFSGFRGINIDATPKAVTALERERPGDINLHAAVSDTREEVTFHLFESSARNTADPGLAGVREPIERMKLVPRTLEDVLDAHLPGGQAIDFMTVDVEGFDLKVLRSNDWQRYRPELVLVEDYEVQRGRLLDSPIYAFMTSQRYIFVSHCYDTSFYRDGAR